MPIIICCSDADRAALAKIAASLEADGNAVTFVEAVVEDPKRLAPVITSHDRQGLYVLCRSKGLDRATVEEMREILLAEQVPFSRTLTVAASRPSMVEERIRSSLGRVLKATQARAAARSAPKPPKSEPAESPTLNLGPPPEADDDGPTLHGLESPDTGVIQAEQTGVKPKPAAPSSSRKGPPPPPPPPPPPLPPPATSEDSVVAPLPPASSVELRRRAPEPGDDSLAQMASSISDIDLSDLDYGDTSIGRAPEDPGSAPRVQTVVTTAEALMQGNTVRARAPTADHMDPGGVTDPLASASIAQAAPPLSPPPLPPTSPPPAPAHSSPSMSPPPPSPAVSTAAAAGVRAPGIPRVAWLAGGGVALGLVALAIVCAVREPEPDEEGDKVASKDASKDASKSKHANASADGEPDPSDDGEDGDGTTPATAADTLTLDGEDAAPSVVLAAIQRRNVRALDILLVQSKSAGVLEFQDAHDYCRTLEIDALADWRLPDIGELHSIGAADMLDSRTAYWSSTPGDTFGDAHLAFAPRRARVINGADKADVLCVRGDRASS